MGTNGRLRASAIGARRGSSLLLFAAALIASAVLALGASASPAGAADSAGGVCGGVAATAPVTAQASADPITAGGVAKWLAIKGATVLGEKAGAFGMEALMKAVGLNSLLPDAEILANLDEIKAQLSGISGQLDGINKSVNQVIAEARKIQLDGVLTNLCSIAAKQEVAFEQDYLPMIEAGNELAHVLAGPNPGQADVKDPATGLSLRERVQKLRDGFVTNYGQAQNSLEAGIKELHSALVPGSVRTSALAVYGKVLMTKRFVGRSDSELLRQLYAGLAEVRAMAALMAAEYRSSEPANRTALNNVLRGYLEGRREETQSLPPMIPSGAVIDLSGPTSETSTGYPIWFAPRDDDTGWLPNNRLPAPFNNVGIDEVDKRVEELNKPNPDDGKDTENGSLGSGWGVPTKEQFETLISEGCTVDADKPKAFVTKPCKNAVGPKSGGNVAGYLLKLNPEDRTWRALFCQPGGNLPCKPGWGPGGNGQPPHAFVWTKDMWQLRMKCGWTILPPRQYTRTYTTYTGFLTAATSAQWRALPPLPEKVPSYELAAESISLERCNDHFTRLARGSTRPEASRSPWVSGALLVTRRTNNADDTNLVSGASGGNFRVDYMGQRSATCGGEAATIVGTGDDDNIRGTTGHDVIVARGGDDLVRALSGHDTVCGGAGNDLLSGGRGNDLLSGQRGNDVLRGGPGNNTLVPGPGRTHVIR